MMKSLSLIVAAFALAGVARADTVGLDIYNTTKANGTNTGETAIGLDVIDAGSTYNFTFTNQSTITSSILHVYFDSSLSSVLGGTGTLSASPGVNYRAATTLVAPQSAASIGWTDTLNLFRSVGTDDVTKITNGIINGGVESLTVSFGKVGGTVLSDVIDLLTTTGGIAVHLVNLEDDGRTTNVDLTTLSAGGGAGGQDDNGTPTAAPSPLAAAGGVALMGLLGLSRRRQA
jgi:hypothetical protein